MAQLYDGAFAITSQCDFDGSRSWWDRAALAFQTPGEHKATVWNHLNIVSALDKVFVDLDTVDAAGFWIKRTESAAPESHLCRVGEVREDDLRARRDANCVLQSFTLACVHVSLFSAPRLLLVV